MSFQTMNRTQLRTACKSAHIQYGKMTVVEMKDALTARSVDGIIAGLRALAPVVTLQPMKALVQGEEVTFVPTELKTIDLDSLPAAGLNGFCPHCGIDHIDNGWTDFDSTVDANQGDVKAALKVMTHEFSCLGCGGEWGPAVKVGKPAKAAREHKGGVGIKIQKDRPVRNGIKRPSAGGKCAAVWEALDAMVAGGNAKPMPADAKAWAEANGTNPNNAVIELYVWRKFNA